FPHLTVAENVGFGLAMQDRPKAEIAATVDEMLALVKMSAMAHRRPSELSGGQQQRVALARALAPRPKVLLLDESLSALDLKLRKEMQIELKRLQHETGITFIFVTHDQEEALTMSDRIAVMKSGRILQVGTPREIYNYPAQRFVADFIGDTNFIEAVVDGAEVILPGGGRMPAQGAGQGVTAGNVSLAVRPEHATIEVPAADSPLSGALQNIVYSGTDTHFHVTLADGARFVVRQQNRPDQALDLSLGQKVGVRFAPDAARILRG
ncbi:MAG: ABC transporter ATP-binding protein, partial [Rhodobacteraceae bacterium]|nr:ABC transporter ATP-binding protein [Paracoccaceae bacterium]